MIAAAVASRTSRRSNAENGAQQQGRYCALKDDGSAGVDGSCHFRTVAELVLKGNLPTSRETNSFPNRARIQDKSLTQRLYETVAHSRRLEFPVSLVDSEDGPRRGWVFVPASGSRHEW
jgi:hypothetical protein